MIRSPTAANSAILPFINKQDLSCVKATEQAKLDADRSPDFKNKWVLHAPLPAALRQLIINLEGIMFIKLQPPSYGNSYIIIAKSETALEFLEGKVDVFHRS